MLNSILSMSFIIIIACAVCAVFSIVVLLIKKTKLGKFMVIKKDEREIFP